MQLFSVLLLTTPAHAADPPAPSVIAAAPDGSLALADLVKPGVFRVDPKGKGDWVFQGSEKQRTPLRHPTSLAFAPDGTLLAADRATGEVYRVEAGKAPVPLTKGALEIPTGLLVTPEGDLLVCDLRLGALFRLRKGEESPTAIAAVPSPRGIAAGPDGSWLVLSMGPDAIVKVTADGKTAPFLKGKPFGFPLAIVRDPGKARWLVSDGDGAAVFEVNEKGEARPWLKGAPLVRPEGLAIDREGALLVADPKAGQVFRATGPDAIRKLRPTG